MDVVDVEPELQQVGTSQYRGGVESFVVIFCSLIVTEVGPTKLSQSGDLDAWAGAKVKQHDAMSSAGTT